jgi:hypothetical protein
VITFLTEKIKNKKKHPDTRGKNKKQMLWTIYNKQWQCSILLKDCDIYKNDMTWFS